MGTQMGRGWFLFVVLVVAGCGYFQAPQPLPVETVEDTTTRLGDKIEASLSDWLALPRAELAKMAHDQAVAVAKQQEFSRHNPEAVDLLPKLNLSAKVPVFDKARFFEATEQTLPPYLKPGQKDALVAMHLARHGDVQAAMKLGNPADDGSIATLNALAAEKNYPVEWTRLVALSIYSAEFKLAGGDVFGAAEIVQLHKQLREVLDSKAAAGPLGAALLPLGKRALTQAAANFRTDKYKKGAVADDVTAALGEWGDIPLAAAALEPKAPRDVVAALLGVPATGRTVAAHGTAVARGLDLLDLPVVDEGVQALVAFLDDRARLGQLLLVYKPRINQEFPEPSDLGQALEERGIAGVEPTKADGLLQRNYTVGKLVYEVNVFTRTTRLGAFVRIGDAAGSTIATQLPANARDFGPIHLDSSYDQNRLAIRPDVRGDKLVLEKADVLAKLRLPVRDPAPSSLTLEREPAQPLVRSLEFHWAADNNASLLAKFLLPMWSAYGPGKFESIADEAGGHFDLVWQSGITRYTLRLPNEDQHGTDLAIADARGPEGLKGRLQLMAAKNEDNRAVRLAAGTAQQRLPRSLHLVGLKLGLPRAQALAALPRGQLARQTPMADGVSVMLLNAPDAKATHTPRQLFVRFGANDKVAEIRVRYQVGPHPADNEHKSLLDALKSGPNGAPETRPSPWAKLWTDLPSQKPAPEMLGWIDDVTVMTYQHDAAGIEVTLLDTDANHPLGVELQPLQFTSRGVEACTLGDSKADIVGRYKIEQPQTTADGALFFGQPENSPYDMVLVWFEDDKAARIVARHKLKNGKPIRVDQVGTILQEVWGENLDRLGTIRRQNGAWGQVYGSYGWHDDKNRVVTHVQDTEPDGPRLFTEWREWPLPEKALAVKP